MGQSFAEACARFDRTQLREPTNVWSALVVGRQLLAWHRVWRRLCKELLEMMMVEVPAARNTIKPRSDHTGWSTGFDHALDSKTKPPRAVRGGGRAVRGALLAIEDLQECAGFDVLVGMG
eukprot:851985-Amphidinium_carterae.1